MAQERRRFTIWLLSGGFAGSLISLFYPIVHFLNPPASAEASVNEASDGSVQDLPPNSGKIVPFGTQPVLLIRVTETDWRALSAVCTHLSCIVQYDPSRRLVWCACHNGLYDLNGKVIAGPPPRPLQEYAVHLRGDKIVISRG